MHFQSVFKRTSRNLLNSIILFFHKFYFILQPVAFKGAVSKNAVQCRTARKQDRLQYKTTAPFATVHQCHVKLHLA